MKRNLASIERFIKKRIKLKLQRDLGKFRVLKEADLQACFYFQLRRYLSENTTWRIFAQKSTPDGKYVDLVIYENNGVKGFKPRIAIELKWNRKRISSKDRDSLRKAVNNLRVRKAYFVTTNFADNYRRAEKRGKEKYKLYEIVIRLDKRIDKKEWFRQRERIKSIRDISNVKPK